MVPRALRGDGEQVGDIIQLQPADHIEHQLLVLVAAVDEDRRAMRRLRDDAGPDGTSDQVRIRAHP